MTSRHNYRTAHVAHTRPQSTCCARLRTNARGQTHLRQLVHKVRIRVIGRREISSSAQIEDFGNTLQRLRRAAVPQQELKPVIHRQNAVAQSDVAGSNSLDERPLQKSKHLRLRRLVAEMLRVHHVAQLFHAAVRNFKNTKAGALIAS